MNLGGGQVLDAAFATYLSVFFSGTKLDDESTIRGELISGFSHRRQGFIVRILGSDDCIKPPLAV